jgi:hypothetical protein
MLTEIWRRYKMAGPAGWVSGEEKREDKRRGMFLVLGLAFAVLWTVGFLPALAVALFASLSWGLYIGYLKRKAGVSLESTDY